MCLHSLGTQAAVQCTLAPHLQAELAGHCHSSILVASACQLKQPTQIVPSTLIMWALQYLLHAKLELFFI